MANAIEQPLSWQEKLNRIFSILGAAGVNDYPPAFIDEPTPAQPPLIAAPELPPRTQPPLAGKTNRQTTPPAPDEIGPGVPITPSVPVLGMDLPEDPRLAAMRRQSRSLFGFSANAPTWTPMASPPMSRKFDKPEFIYTNPVAAQQATAQYGTRLNTEAAQDASYRDYLARLNAERNANQRNAQQAEFSRQLADDQNKLARDTLAAQQQEGAANRASAERIAQISELIRQHRQAEVDWQQNERLADIADGMADQLNRDPNNMKGIDRRLVRWDGVAQKWVGSIRRTTRPVPPDLSGTNIPSPIGGVQSQSPPVTVPSTGNWTEVSPAWPQPQPLPITVPDLDFIPSDFAPRRKVIVPNPPPAPMIDY